MKRKEWHWTYSLLVGLCIGCVIRLSGCVSETESERPWGYLGEDPSILHYPDEKGAFLKFVRTEHVPEEPERLQEIDGIPCSYEFPANDGKFHVYRLHASEIVIDRESHQIIRWEPAEDGDDHQ